MGLKPEEIQLFKLVIKDLLISVKNGTLYDFEHPIYLLSIKKLKSSIDEWFKIQKQFILGFSSHRILMNSELIERKEEFLYEMARMLHVKGILSVELHKNVEAKELAGFVFHLKMDTPNEVAEATDWASDFPNIRVKELDYRLLLTSQSTEYTTEEEEVWARLFRMDISFDKGLSSENIEHMLKFFNEPVESASFLNKVYREALKKESDDQIALMFQQAVFSICEYFRGQSKVTGEQKSFKINLARIISRLHPDLIGQLFESTVINGQNFDMAKELINDFSNQDIAEFVQSLIHQDGSINEYLLKVFQKMMPNEQDAGNVAPLVADELFNKHILNPNSFKQIQLSIKELFKKNPSNYFLNEMYKITVDALSDTSYSHLKFTVRMGPLINQFVKTYEEDFFTDERTWILLKVLSGETNFIDFQKYGEKLLELFHELLEKKDVAVMSRTVSFYMAKIAAKSSNASTPLDREKKSLLNKIMNDSNIKSVIDLVPDASEEDLQHIAQVLMFTKAAAARQLVDMFLAAKRPAVREKLLFIFSNMRSVINAEAMQRMGQAKSHEVRELFKILQVCDPEKMNLAARKMINQKDVTLLWDALEHFIPRCAEDVEQLSKLVFKHGNPEIQKKAAVAILKSKNHQFAEDLFEKMDGGIFNKKHLHKVVIWSGEARSDTALIELKKVFLKKSFFFFRSTEIIRLSALKSMMLINQAKAVEAFQSVNESESAAFKEKCEAVLKKYKNT